MANPTLHLFLSFAILYILPTDAIYKSVCDCSKPKAKGLLNLNDPYYCKTLPPEHSEEKLKDYEIITTVKPAQKWKAYTCSQWVKTKRIVGSFWIGSFDTTYFHDSMFVEPADCWNMVMNKKCGGNTIIQSGTTYTFSSEPVGDGKWYSTTDYKTLNCLAEEITMSQETPTSPLHSPFGYHNVSIQSEKFIFNHNTIVWRTQNVVNTTCSTSSLIHGTGKYSTSIEKHRGRLLDETKQIEILFNISRIEICQPGLAPALTGFAVMGLPDTFILIQGIGKDEKESDGKRKRSIDGVVTFDNSENNKIDSPDYDLDAFSPPEIGLADFEYLEKQLNEKNRLHNMSYAWGRIKHYSSREDDTLSSYSTGMEMRLTYTFTPELLALNTAHDFNQQFIYLIDQTIRKDKTNLCVTTTPWRHGNFTDRYITLKECSRHTSRWIFDKESRQLIEEKTLLCLGLTDEFEVMLQTCSRNSLNSSQMWEFENWNLSPELLELYPPMTIDDLEDVRREFQGKTTSITINKDVTLNFGRFYNGHISNDSCLAVSNRYVTDNLILKSCTADSEYELNFEYLRDGTIRPFQSVMCIRADRHNATLRPCDSNSQTFSRDFQTAQFVERDTRQCLQAQAGRLLLGRCNERRAKTIQRWQFEFNNMEYQNATRRTPTAELVALSLTNSVNSPADVLQRTLEPQNQLPSANEKPATQQGNLGQTNPSEQTTTTTVSPHNSIPTLTIGELHLFNASIAHLRNEVEAIKNDKDVNDHKEKLRLLEVELLAIRTLVGSVRQLEIASLQRDVANLRNNRNPVLIETLQADIALLERLVLHPTDADIHILSTFKDTVIANLTNEVKVKFASLHSQYKQEILIENENKLAREIRQVYCQVSALERNQAIMMAQGNGLLAAAALSLPICTRLQGFGQTVLLEQCAEQQINITAIETNCGYQPYFLYNHQNYTVGMDGWSIHPFSNCFWQSHLININGKPYKWIHNTEHGDWVEQKPNLHSTNLELIAEFDELPLNDFDFTLSAHPAHETIDLEQLNVLNDLMGRIQETNSNSFSAVVQTEVQTNNIKHVFTWVDTLKIMTLSVIGFVLFLICVRLFIALNPFPKLTERSRERKERRKIKRYNKSASELQASVPMLPIQASSPVVRATAPPTENEIHSHNHCTYVVGKGLVWEDLCPCNPDQ